MYEWRNPGGGFSEARPAREIRLYLALGVAVLAIMLALGALVGWVVHRSNAQYAEFMQGCLQDHKKYECMAIWRAGDRNAYPLIVPLPVPTTR